MQIGGELAESLKFLWLFSDIFLASHGTQWDATAAATFLLFTSHPFLQSATASIICLEGPCLIAEERWQ